MWQPGQRQVRRGKPWSPRLAVHHPRAGLPVADPQQLGLPLLAVGLHAPEHRRLCENTVDRVDHTAHASWNAPGALDHIEWFQGIRTVTTANSDYYIQESLHPDCLAQLALRNCVRQAYNGGTPKGGTCKLSATGRNANGEPNTALS
jgi:hypothetical protein